MRDLDAGPDVSLRLPPSYPYDNAVLSLKVDLYDVVNGNVALFVESDLAGQSAHPPSSTTTLRPSLVATSHHIESGEFA
jgi:hypothetical protein